MIHRPLTFKDLEGKDPILEIVKEGKITILNNLLSELSKEAGGDEEIIKRINT